MERSNRTKRGLALFSLWALGCALQLGGWYLVRFLSDLPIYITAPLWCLMSLPLTVICIYIKKMTSRVVAVLPMYLAIPVISAILTAATYISSSYFYGDFFISAQLFFSGLLLYVFSVFTGLCSVVTVFIYLNLKK